MKFKRINVDTVRCLVSEEELHENGLEVEDFLRNDGKTEPFLRKIISMAEEEVGYRVQGGNISIQVAVLPEHVIALTFSERPDQGFANMLENLRDAVRHLAEAAADTVGADPAGEGEKKPKAVKPEQAAEAMAVMERDCYQISFSSLDDVIAYSRGIALECEVSSSLYYVEQDKAYYLILEKGEMDKKQICRLIAASLDFSDGLYAQKSIWAWLREHGTCMIPDHAIEHLQEI